MRRLHFDYIPKLAAELADVKSRAVLINDLDSEVGHDVAQRGIVAYDQRIKDIADGISWLGDGQFKEVTNTLAPALARRASAAANVSFAPKAAARNSWPTHSDWQRLLLSDGPFSFQFPLLYRSQRLLQIGDQIVDMLQPDR